MILWRKLTFIVSYTPAIKLTAYIQAAIVLDIDQSDIGKLTFVGLIPIFLEPFGLQHSPCILKIFLFELTPYMP